jgi:hypothetical protein
VLEAPERCPAGRVADDEHPPIVYPGPLGIVELPFVENCRRRGEHVSKFPSAYGASAAWIDGIGGYAGDTMSESCVSAPRGILLPESRIRNALRL